MFSIKDFDTIFDSPSSDVSSPWMGHIPFAFFMINILKPKTFVELGVYNGTSYNAFCQAVKQTKFKTRCFGIDTFLGDKQSGFYSDKVYSELHEYQEKNYGEFSSLLKMTFDEGINQFKDNSIDLLHIDGLHTYEQVKHDFENWLPKMSKQGVVLFHDTCVRDDDFGVWKLWGELTQKYPSFEFTHSYGLGALAVGTDVNASFLEFIQDTENKEFYCSLFSSLGSSIERKATHLRLEKELENIRSIAPSPKHVQLFIDSGQGFNEKGSIVIPVEEGKTTGNKTYTFSLESFNQINNLRFDPLNTYALVYINEIEIESKKAGKIRLDFGHNAAYQDNDILFFDTEDPQILCDVSKIPHVTNVKIDIDIIASGEEALLKIIRANNTQQKKITEEANKTISTLENRIEEKEDEIKKTQTFADHLSKEIKELQSKNEQSSSLISTLQESRKSTEEELEDLRDKNYLAEKEIVSKNNLISEIETEKQLLEQHSSRQEKLIHEIKKSFSYRLGRLLSIPARELYELTNKIINQNNAFTLYFRLLSIGIKQPFRTIRKLNKENLRTLKKAVKSEKPDQIAFNLKLLLESREREKITTRESFDNIVIETSHKLNESSSGQDMSLEDQITLIKNSGYFDHDYYLSQNPDINSDRIDPIQHFCQWGWKEGRDPNPDFSIIEYKERYNLSDENPLVFHLEINGPVAGKSNEVLSKEDYINDFSQARPDFIDHTLKHFKQKHELQNIDISAVTFNSSKWIKAFFNSLINQDYPLSMISVHIRDNGSTDDTLELLENFRNDHIDDFTSINISKGENVGFGQGHDSNIRGCRNEFIIVSNIDLEFEKSAISRIVQFALQDSENTGSWEFRQKPYEHPKYYDPVTLETNWSSHACILIRRSVYEKIGGYSKDIFMYGEDVEYSYHLTKEGYKLRYLPDAVVHHHTYEVPAQVKSRQYFGSIFANGLIRLKYGTLYDIQVMHDLFNGLINSDIQNSKEINKIYQSLRIRQNAILSDRASELNKDASFYFHGWDYAFNRNGAFYEIPDRKSTPLVSIIVRTYKGRGLFLRQCLFSILNQTYHNIEVIVVEDGGHSQASLLDDLAPLLNKKGKVVKVIPLKKVGRCIAGNSGLENTTGEYVMFLDDDDLIFSDHIEVLVSEMCINPSAPAAYTQSLEIETLIHKEENTITGYTEKKSLEFGWNDTAFSRERLKTINLFPIQAVLFKRECYERYGGFEPELTNLEDWNLWIKYSTKGDFIKVDKVTSLFRTPFDRKEKKQRMELLDEYYSKAKALNKKYY